jgi:signal transduction histidine kinase
MSEVLESFSAGQVRVVEMIAQDEPLDDILEQLVLLMEAQTEGMYGSVVLLEDDGVHMSYGVGPHLPPEYVALMPGFAIGPAVCSCGTAMYTRKMVIVADVLNDPRWAGFKHLIEPHGFRACWSAPILAGDVVLGTFAMYYRDVRVPGPKDTKLLDLATHMARIAIERHRARTELARYRDHLEDVVNTRTQELEAARKELEAFSHSVAHDLRAPLRRIDGFSEILIEDFANDLSDAGRKYLDRIRAGCQQMNALIHDMLELSLVARGTLKREPIDITALAGDVVSDLRSAAPDRTVDVKILSHMTARADPRLLKIAFVNLIGNAWKYTSRTKDARVEVGTTTGGDGVVFYVKDNGVGFDAEHAAQLFAPFQRFHSAREFEGTGIGLATVQRIVHRHAGSIWCESAVGAGCTFFFTIPESGETEEAG